MPSALGLIRVVSNAELNADDQKRQVAAEEHNNTPLLQGLAKHVMDCWGPARDARNSGVLPRLQKAKRARMGEYDPAKLAAIREFGGSEEYARITANKCRTIEAWLRDIFLGQTEKPWTLNHTPVPDFPPELQEEIKAGIAQEVAAVYAQTGQMPPPEMVRQAMTDQMDAVQERLRDEARKSVARMERLMDDQMVQGGFRKAIAQFIADLTTYPTAVLKGPIIRRSKRLTWKNAEGATSPQVEDVIAPEWERVDPFRVYPAPGATSPQDGYFFEHITLTYQSLYELIGTPGYDEEAIRAVLRACDGVGFSNWLGLNPSDDSKDDDTPHNLVRQVFNIDCLEYTGPVKGRDLLAWGMDEEEVEDPDAAYDACVLLIDKWVIKAQLNYDPLGKRGYYASSYEPVPGSFWGWSLPDVLEDVQGVANAAVRSLVNNMGIASGPQVEVNIDRLPADADISNLHPWKIWQVTDSQYGGGQGKAVDFFQPQSNVNDLLAIMETFYRLADDFSLIPRYMAGNEQASGAGRTASGLSMLMDAANKGLKGVVSNIDNDILTPMLNKLYAHNMMYEEDETVKGDAQAVARGAVSLMQLESLQLRRNEFLNATANPIDSQIVGQEGRAEILREVAKGLEMDVSKIIPPREVLQQQQAAMQQQEAAEQGTQGGAPGGEQLANGAAVTDNFSPNALTP